jgi:CRP/FNR family cyclic AMP-dependent transcriptional regulator
MPAEKTKLWYIQNFDPFRHMRDEDYDLIDEHSHMREVKKGEVLYLEGSSDMNIYMLKKGAVKISKLNPQGKEIILDIFGQGAIFGEMPGVDLETRDESAVVVEDGLICTMERKYFDRALQAIPDLSTSVTKMIGLRRHKIENKLISLLYSSVRQRLARTLLTLLEEFGAPHDKGRMINVKLTHMDYADLIASTRETVTAELNKLRSEGVIDFDGKHVVVTNADRLRSIAG